MQTGPLTMHTKTAIYIAELLTKAKFEVTEVNEKVVNVQCHGIGFFNQR